MLITESLRGDAISNRVNGPFEKITFRGFSQSDEDGLLAEIVRIIGGPHQKKFIECGVGDGTENNSLLLLLSGWEGVWYGGEKLSLELNPSVPLKFDRQWIDIRNVESLMFAALEYLQIADSKQLDVFSLDLDGNDYHLCKNLLSNDFRPQIWIQEYNAVFGPHVEWIMPYNNSHVWGRDNFFGASFKSYCNLFAEFGYRAVVCSATGANIFFVREDLNFPFVDLPDEQVIWSRPNYNLTQNGHPTSKRILHGYQRLSI